MSRLASCLQELAQDGRKALVTFITAGDPDPSQTVGAMHALCAGGADVIELGVPFSDPEAEGPAIQASSERALAHGVSLLNVLDMVREFRTTDSKTPIVLMGYLNSVLRMGEETFAAAAAAAGCDGLIMVNLPPESADRLRTALATHGIDLIFLIAPTTTASRAQEILRQTTGFAYYVSLTGITGASHIDPTEVNQRVAALQAHAKVPIMVGFGIKDAASAQAVGQVANGVVVGSALVKTMGGTPIEQIGERLTAQVQALRDALDTLER